VQTPCQRGFGSCDMKEPPRCGPGSQSAKKRRVAYYQGLNTRERKCDRVSPSQIDIKGLTHLIYAFVFFDPATFQIIPMPGDDINQYREFTKLQAKSLKTWVGIGGWLFNEPGPNQRAFSDMVSSRFFRATFIKSLIQFMVQHDFQGADIDWEYPGYVKGQDQESRLNRGGRKEDTANLVLLIKEMRVAFNAHPAKFGLSIVLAPDITYLMNFKPREMQDYVDFFGFMAYDLGKSNHNQQ
jgi:chitinase